MPETAAEWDRRLDRAIRRAADEAREKGNTALADMLLEFLLAMGASREIALSRLRSLGIASLTQEEHDKVLRLVADAAAEKVVQEARLQVQTRQDTWWSRTSVRVAVVAGAAGILLSGIGTIVNLLASLSRHTP